MTYRLPGKYRRLVRLLKQDLTKSILTITQILFIFLIVASPAGEAIDNLQLQVFFNLRGSIQEPKDIIIAAIDDKSFYDEKISSLQAWPRQLLLEAIINIKNSGAKLIVIDMLFDRNTKIEGVDQNIIRAISEVPTSIAMFESFVNTKDITGKTKQELQVEKPSDELIKAAKFLTPMMVRVDHEDGKVKRFYYSKRYLNEGKSPIPLANVAEFFLNKKLKQIPKQQDYINYYGPSGSIKTISINMLLDKNINEKIKNRLKDKIVVIGTFKESKVDSKSEDQFNTTFNPIFGAEIHATILANLISNNWIKRLGTNVDLCILFIFAIISSFRSISAGPLKGSIFAMLSGFALCFISYQLFLRQYFIPCLVYSILIVPILIIGILTYHYFVTLTAFKNVEEALGVSLRPKK